MWEYWDICLMHVSILSWIYWPRWFSGIASLLHGEERRKKSIVAFCLGILRHTSRGFFEYQYVYVSCTAVLLQHENSKNKCQSIEQQGKKVEQKLICHYKKETTKNKKTGAISPQRKIHYFFLLYNGPPYNKSMCETWLISKPTQFMSWKVGNCGTLKTGLSRIHLNQWTWMGQLLKCLSLLWTLNVLNLC